MANDNHSAQQSDQPERAEPGPSSFLPGPRTRAGAPTPIERWTVKAQWQEEIEGKPIWRTGSWSESRGDTETIQRILSARK